MKEFIRKFKRNLRTENLLYRSNSLEISFNYIKQYEALTIIALMDFSCIVSYKKHTLGLALKLGKLKCIMFNLGNKYVFLRHNYSNCDENITIFQKMKEDVG